MPSGNTQGLSSDPTIADLQTRVGNLEALLSEESQPNYLTYDPVTGLIGALFPGGIQLEEDAVTAKSPGTLPNAVTWLRQAGGGLAAQIFAQRNSANPARPADNLYLQRYEDATTDSNASIVASILDPSGVTLQEVTVISRLGSSLAQVAGVAIHTCLIDDNDGTGYNSGIQPVAAGVEATIFTLTTVTPSWAFAVPVGALLNTGNSLAPADWFYTFAAPNSFDIQLANNSIADGTYRWVGVVIGVP